MKKIHRTLHLHPRYYAMELVRGELVELDDVRGKQLDDREYLPDEVRGNDVLDAVENGLLVYARLPQYLLYVRHLHVTDLYLKGSEPGCDVVLEKARYAERIFPAHDGHDDIVLVDNVVLEYGMDNIWRHLKRVLGE